MSEAIAAIHLPKDVSQMIATTLRAEQDHTQSHIDAEKARLTKELNSLQTQRDEAYTDKLRGEITVEFWRARQAKWAEEEVAIKAQLSSLEDEKTPRRFVNLHFTLELAQTIDSKLVTANEFEKANLAKIVLSNSKIDAVSLYPTYRKPFDVIVRRAKNEEWLRGLDLNQRPLGYE
ncbi:MAG TPA: hypothetical protein VG893_11945 [Terracidiphilus sp.]|nr:hypothetical protein [Terracidiphilus sp.]